MTINVKDFERIEGEIRRSMPTDNYEHTLKKYTGPGTGLIWDEEAEKLTIATDWYADAEGNIVRK